MKLLRLFILGVIVFCAAAAISNAIYGNYYWMWVNVICICVNIITYCWNLEIEKRRLQFGL